MTMHPTSHPDDERLAAYAGGDTDALADRDLVAHLSVCDRCGPLVDELTMLRGALAALPDLVPSRPLRLIPPVPAAASAPQGILGWLRRLAAPAMAAGAGLVLVGAIGVGASGAVGNLFGQAASGPGAMEATASDNAHAPAAGGAPSLAPRDTTNGEVEASGQGRSLSSSRAPEATPNADDRGRTDEVAGASAPEQPWLTLLIAGVALFAISTVLRFSLGTGAG